MIKIILIKILLMFSIVSHANEEITYSWSFADSPEYSVKMTKTNDFKKYQICKAFVCEDLGATSSIDLMSISSELAGVDLSPSQKIQGAAIGTVIAVGSFIIVVRTKMVLNKFKLDSTQDTFVSDIIFGLLGIVFAKSMGVEGFHTYKEWIIGDEISEYESTAIAKTLLVLDRLTRNNSGGSIKGKVGTFKNQLKLAIHVVNSEMEKLDSSLYYQEKY